MNKTRYAQHTQSVDSNRHSETNKFDFLSDLKCLFRGELNRKRREMGMVRSNELNTFQFYCQFLQQQNYFSTWGLVKVRTRLIPVSFTRSTMCVGDNCKIGVKWKYIVECNFNKYAENSIC